MASFVPQEAIGNLGASLTFLIESLLTADHGQTVRYTEDKSGSVQPDLGESPTGDLQNQREMVGACCATYAEECMNSPAWPVGSSVRDGLAESFLSLCRQPRREEAALFKTWMCELAREQNSPRPLVRNLSVKDLAKLTRARLALTPQASIYLSSPWLMGGIAASPWLTRTLGGFLGCRETNG
jgi:hypothetical protein